MKRNKSDRRKKGGGGGKKEEKVANIRVVFVDVV